MDLATMMSIVQSVLATIQCCDQLFKDRSFTGYKSELESLRTTLDNVNAVLQDAEAKQDALSFQQKQYVEELRDAVYDADDVLDEFSTLVHREKLILDGGNLTGKVKSFLYKFKPLALTLSKKVKKVGKKLEGIATRKNLFSIDVNHQSIKFRKEESCSYVHTVDIIGRDTDVETIVGILLDPDTGRDVSCLSVVGMGGLGKTALAQLVYNDERVKSAFPMKLWACVSDQDPNHLQLEPVLRKILAAATGDKNESPTYDEVQRQLRERLSGEKYLLVLDDVWNENRDEWMNLVGFLKGGKKGSWILVTTRSEKTAEIIGNGPTYSLPGLSEEDSWRLFKNVAFDSENTKSLTDDLVTIGKEIVKSCANVPLAIRAMGSLLYGQPRSIWLSFQTKGLTSISEDKHNIKPILKLSYYHLESSLKSCFTFCAVFPKDHTLYKKTLIWFWIAQGYIIPQEGRHMVDVGDEYFSVLMRRCFFQDVHKDEKGDVYSCKMHDLMHDIAQEVAGSEICIAGGHSINVDGKVRHLGFQGSELSKFSFEKTGLRTFLRVGIITLREPFPLGKLLMNCSCLRILDLSELGPKCLPESIGKLLHLRWLNLSSNSELEVLPEVITKLYNLQILGLSKCKRLKKLPEDINKLVNLIELDISGCVMLKELPKDINKLINLRVLNISGCYGLTYMPLGLGKLISLDKLGYFVVGHASGSRKYQCVLEELDELKPLNNLKGSLRIKIRVPENVKYSDTQGGRGGYLKLKQHLTCIFIEFKEEKGYGNREYEEMLLDYLQPHPNLRKLKVYEYKGERMPRWPGDGLNPPLLHLPNLVSLEIAYCGELRSLACIGRLPLLKELTLRDLEKVEYIVEEEEEDSEGGEPSFSYFPELDYLSLCNLRRLKGWWRRSSSSPPYLPLLKSLQILGCGEFQMASIPCCPRLESLHMDSVNFGNRYGERSYMRGDFAFLWEVSNSTLTANFKALDELFITNDGDVESLREMNDLIQGIRILEIRRCMKLRSVSGWIEHLHSLKRLNLFNCPNLLVRNNEDEEEDGIPWRHLPPTLHKLALGCFEDMEKVPEGVKYCTSLRSLEIHYCEGLRSVRGWIEHLHALERLTISNCPNLLVRNNEMEEKEEDGVPWRHLPLTLQELELLHFEDMEKVPEGVKYCTSLHSLKISWCPELKSMPIWMPNLTSLTTLNLTHCGKLEERCKKFTGVDWPLIQHIPNIHIDFDLW